MFLVDPFPACPANSTLAHLGRPPIYIYYIYYIYMYVYMYLSYNCKYTCMYVATHTYTLIVHSTLTCFQSWDSSCDGWENIRCGLKSRWEGRCICFNLRLASFSCSLLSTQGELFWNLPSSFSAFAILPALLSSDFPIYNRLC